MTKGNPTTACGGLLRNYHLQPQATPKAAGESDSSPLLPTLLEAISHFLCYPQASVASSPLTPLQQTLFLFHPPKRAVRNQQPQVSPLTSFVSTASPAPSPILCGPTPSLTLLCALGAIPSPLPKASTQGHHRPPRSHSVNQEKNPRSPQLTQPPTPTGAQSGVGGGWDTGYDVSGPCPCSQSHFPIVNTSPCLTDSLPSALQQAVIFFHL